jgi:phage major head subunit gpT-like protein
MDITHENLADLFRGYQAAYNEGVTRDQAATQWPLIAERTASMTSEETYDWLKDIPGLREWVGDRFVHQLGTTGFRLVNKDYDGHWKSPLRAMPAVESRREVGVEVRRRETRERAGSLGR